MNDTCALSTWVRQRHVQLVLHEFYVYSVLSLGRLGFKRRQRDPAARDDGLAHGREHVAAHRADIELRAKRIRGTIGVAHVGPSEKLRHRHAERGRQWFQERDVGVAASALPARNDLFDLTSKSSRCARYDPSTVPLEIDVATGIEDAPAHRLRGRVL